MTDFNMCEVLSEATDLKPNSRENAFEFTRRLMKVLSADDFSTDKWDALPDEAQEWVNEQIRYTNENKQVTEVPGYVDFFSSVYPSRFKTATETVVETQPAATVANGEAEVEEEEEVEEVEEEEVVAKEKPKRAKVATDPKERTYRQRKSPDGKPSAIMRLKEMLIEDGTLTPNHLMQKLESEGYRVSQSTVISCKADFRATVSVLQRHGLMNVELIK